MFVVAEVQTSYLAPARLDDEITVTVSVIELGAASMVLEQQAWRSETLLATGRIRIGCVDGATLRPRRIPAPVVTAINGA
jgi:acyl-CoA thioester hydrolase